MIVLPQVPSQAPHKAIFPSPRQLASWFEAPASCFVTPYRVTCGPALKKSKNMKTTTCPARPASPTRNSPLYALRKGLGMWELTFNGQNAILKHEQGLAYVAHLLLNPPSEPIHGLALALSVRAVQHKQNADGEILLERNLALDDAELAHALYLKQKHLESLADDVTLVEPVKKEVLQELEALYQFQKKNLFRTNNAAQKASDAVGRAIKRFHKRIASAVDAQGSPNLLLRRFAEHLRSHLLIPSGRCGGHGGFRAKGFGGCFTYEPPSGIIWKR
jgi:hypothetical protein